MPQKASLPIRRWRDGVGKLPQPAQGGGRGAVGWLTRIDETDLANLQIGPELHVAARDVIERHHHGHPARLAEMQRDETNAAPFKPHFFLELAQDGVAGGLAAPYPAARQPPAGIVAVTDQKYPAMGIFHQRGNPQRGRRPERAEGDKKAEYRVF